MQDKLVLPEEETTNTPVKEGWIRQFLRRFRSPKDKEGPTKFGTFQGVFTPTLLTILGVIMYLRGPWVVGNAGVVGAIGIITLATAITACTALSMSSIVVGFGYFQITQLCW